MQLPITDQEAATNSKAYNEISQKLGSDVTWAYEWCVTIKSTRFDDILNGNAKRDSEAYRKLTADQRVKDIEPRITCSLIGRKKGKRKTSVILDSVPAKVLDSYRKQYTLDVAEEQRIDSLTPEQRQKEVQDTLRKLGFSLLDAKHIAEST